MKKKEMRRRLKQVDIVRKNLIGLSTYVNKFPPTEYAQGVQDVSLKTANTLESVLKGEVPDENLLEKP